VGLVLWAAAAAWLLTTDHPRHTVLEVTSAIASLGHGAFSVASPVRLAISVTFAFTLLVPLLAAVPARPRPSMATVIAALVATLSGIGLRIASGGSQVVDFTAAAILGSLIGWLVAAGLRGAGSHRSLPRGFRVAAGVLLVSFFVVAGIIGFWHEPVDSGSRSGLKAALAVLHRRGAPSWFDYDGVEFAANIVFFVPLGFLLTLVLPPRHWGVTVVVGCCSSASIEIGQAMFVPARIASVDDFAANSLGALLGAFVALAMTSELDRRRREKKNL